MSYLFTSERLGFRNWKPEDLSAMSAMNADEQVMEFFPNTQTEAQTAAFIKRMESQFLERGFCYFAVEKLENQAFIGFIGIDHQTYEAAFNPAVDIGWRLAPNAWGKGYATEGAKRCLKYAFEVLKLEKVFSVAPAINKNSINVMKKAGMKFHSTFNHPKLLNDERLKECVAYVLSY
jgi:RimJ/RimL family protein N-acetyltransferase